MLAVEGEESLEPRQRLHVCSVRKKKDKLKPALKVAQRCRAHFITCAQELLYSKEYNSSREALDLFHSLSKAIGVLSDVEYELERINAEGESCVNTKC